MKKLLMLSMVVVFKTTILHSQTKILVTEILPVVGSWKGTLTYLDYTTKKITEIPTTLDIEQIKWGVFTCSHQFPKEPHIKWTDTFALSKDGIFFGNGKIVNKQILPNGTLEFVTEEAGFDDKKPASIRKTFGINSNAFYFKKEVQIEGEQNWFLRNEYHYKTRVKFLTPKQMKQDIAIIKTTWEQIHPGLYRYNTKSEIESYFKDLDNKTNNSLELRQFFILISQLNIKLKCGHSFVSYYNNKTIIKNNLYSSIFFPVLFNLIQKKFIVTHNLSEQPNIKLGDEITAINGIPTNVIIDSLLKVSKADGKNGLNKKLDNISFQPREIYTDRYSLFDIYFPLFFKKI